MRWKWKWGLRERLESLKLKSSGRMRPQRLMAIATICERSHTEAGQFRGANLPTLPLRLQMPKEQIYSPRSVHLSINTISLLVSILILSTFVMFKLHEKKSESI